MSVGLLRRFRTEARLTIEALAETLSVSARGIGSLERGERTVPQRREVAALAMARDWRRKAVNACWPPPVRDAPPGRPR
ncbi:helix-turn-helix domain-containing protein [Streptomyces sp. RM72]|nr:helix-turn-helix domain-containing protein [Streptomyces sp. RM72]